MAFFLVIFVRSIAAEVHGTFIFFSLFGVRFILRRGFFICIYKNLLTDVKSGSITVFVLREKVLYFRTRKIIMNKRLLFLVLFLAMTAALIFAGNPAPSKFDVETEIKGINLMKITEKRLPVELSSTEFLSAKPFIGPVTVGSDGQVEAFSAHLSTLSNNRKGYTVTMKATAMKSTIDDIDAYIDYRVYCGDPAGGTDTPHITTNGPTSDPEEIEVIFVKKLKRLECRSEPIAIFINSTTFDAAVEGHYRGTVTFTYKAN